MIITLLALVLIIIPCWLMSKRRDAEFSDGLIIIFIIGCIAMLCCLVIIIGEHAMAASQINKNKIQYESLQRRLEVINSEYEDVSKSDIIKDISKWNQKAYSYKYWNNNLFTNWMFSDELAESYKYIEY